MYHQNWPSCRFVLVLFDKCWYRVIFFSLNKFVCFVFCVTLFPFVISPWSWSFHSHTHTITIISCWIFLSFSVLCHIVPICVFCVLCHIAPICHFSYFLKVEGVYGPQNCPMLQQCIIAGTKERFEGYTPPHSPQNYNRLLRGLLPIRTAHPCGA